jgi:hypothetical protein
MSDLRAEPLSPIDAATLWPQLHRLSTEVIATRAGENLLVSSGLAATGITRLPRVPRTAVLGVKRGLGYRGVAVARELAGGAGWEAVSVRIARDKDDEAVLALLASACREVAARGGRTVYLRYAEGSPHASPVKQAGFMAYTLERLHALPRARARHGETPFRPAHRPDRAGIFRLYCRAVPEHIRRQEAPSQQDWRAVVDSYDCESEWVLEQHGALAGWCAIGEREARVLHDGSMEGAASAALDLIESHLGRSGTLVLAEHQPDLERIAAERGYTELGTRLMCARRLAALNPLKEVSAVSAIETAPLPQ